MYPTSEAYKRALSGSGGVVVVRADLYRDNALIHPGLPIQGGAVDVDGTAEIRRTLSNLVITDKTGVLVPARAGDALTPYGNEIRVYRGFSAATVGATVDEMIPLGVFRLSEASIEDQPAGQTVVVRAYDRARTISRNRLTDVYVIGKNQNFATAIADLLDFVLPGVTGDRSTFAATAELTPQIILQIDSDPWAEALRMAETIGMELFFGIDGVPILQPVTDPTTAPLSASYVEGDTARPLLGIRRGFSDEPGWNGVIVLGESTSAAAPVRGEAWDTNPDSPTYYLGPYGKVPKVERSELAYTQTAANAQAAASLQRHLGGMETLDFAVAPDPAHEAGDAVLLRRARSKIDQIATLQSFTVPLSVTEEMSITTKSRRSAAA